MEEPDVNKGGIEEVAETEWLCAVVRRLTSDCSPMYTRNKFPRWFCHYSVGSSTSIVSLITALPYTSSCFPNLTLNIGLPKPYRSSPCE